MKLDTYEDLWDIYNQNDGENALSATSDEEARKIISTLVNTNTSYKEVNCMGILECVRPKLHGFIRYWTAGESAKIRDVQEGKKESIFFTELIAGFMSEAHFLPKYPGPFIHYSKDTGWANNYRCGDVLEIRSFMGCASDGSRFVHAGTPRIYFSPSAQVCYLGSLTTTPPEREVIVMPGSAFKVIHTDGQAIYVEDLC